MKSSQKIVLEQLNHIWMKHVLSDYFEGNLTYGEQVVHASIAHHLRNHLRELPDFRVWHEVRIDAINTSLKRIHRKDGRTIDLVLSFADIKNLTEEVGNEVVPLDLLDITDVELFAAIEIKYAPYAVGGRKLKLDEDIDKLIDIRKEYLPDIHPIFAYIPGTDQIDELDDWKNMLSKKAEENSVSFLFGHPLDSKEWTVNYNR